MKLWVLQVSPIPRLHWDWFWIWDWDELQIFKLCLSDHSFRCSLQLPRPSLPLVVVRACIRVGSPEKALHFVREKVEVTHHCLASRPSPLHGKMAYAIQAAVPNFEQIFRPSRDFHMTITWPSHDHHTVSHDHHMTSHDPHMTLTWLMIDAVLLVLGMCSSQWWYLWSDVASLVSGSLWDLPLTKSVPHTDGRSAHRQQCRRYLQCL